MRYKLIALSIVTALGLFSFLNNSRADGTVTVNGVGLTVLDDGNIAGLRAEHFASYALGTSGTYVYNGSGGTSSTAGSVKVFGCENMSAVFQITTTDSGVCTIRPEYQIGTTAFWHNGSTTAITGTGTAVITITDTPITNLRFGLIKTGTTTGVVTMVGEYYRYLRR